jgi:predicted transport protein
VSRTVAGANEGTRDESKSELSDLYESLKAFLVAMGDGVQVNTLKYYVAFKRLKNFACVEVYPKVKKLIVYVKVDPTTVELKEGFTRDVRNVGHYGTGDLQITISTVSDFEEAKSFLIQSYEAS